MPARSPLSRYVLLGTVSCIISAFLGIAGLVLGGVAAPPGAGDRPAAVLDNQAIGWPEVAPLLAEASGSVVLEEIVLSRALDQLCKDQSIAVGEKQLQSERELLVRSLARAAQVPESEGERLVQDVRISRGLGERRFEDLLRRNAMLRSLVQKAAGPSGVSVSPEDVEQAFALRYGPRVRARMILVRTQEQVAEASKRLADGESFSDVATRLSADPSRMRGGMLDPISPADPSYPVAFRRAIEETQPGAVSSPVMVSWDAQPGFALVRVEERVPAANVARADVNKDLESEVRAVRERGLMDRLARTLIDTQASKLSVLDNALEWSWRNRRRPE